MRQLRKLAAGIAVAAAVAVVASAVPALADPPMSGGKQVVPGTVDMVSVGANTDENLFNALSGAWDKTITPKEHGAAHPYIYSLNARPRLDLDRQGHDRPKKGCAPITRPNGSGAGLTALDESQKIDKTVHCVDFARSSSGRSATLAGAEGRRRRLRRAGHGRRHLGGQGHRGTKTVPASYAPKSLTTGAAQGHLPLQRHQLEGRSAAATRRSRLTSPRRARARSRSS